ncbi:GNAT family N-acetyltransferase [Pseudohoeflea sp. DP4N28-3]|uniref:GNAT family N-acetyltransferase n=1 Tax=Pseudohoeflea coraliihabitans TaxID=2860393 RepID=A0ABS6WL65_9HYPH|nr:GNAT family N-acetyltransferase [Pseudohoeflea sp. DP4N28-3]
MDSSGSNRPPPELVDQLPPDGHASHSAKPAPADPVPLHDYPVLSTERLTLRTPRNADIDAISILANDPAIAFMLPHMPHPYGRADAADFVRKACQGGNGNGIYAITDTATGRFLGCCALRPGSTGSALEIGYWVGRPYWGRGYATEAVHALIDLGFRATSVDHVDASCRVTNPASRRVLQKSGFQFHGSEMLAVMALNATVAGDHFRLDRKTWLSLTTWRTQQP